MELNGVVENGESNDFQEGVVAVFEALSNGDASLFRWVEKVVSGDVDPRVPDPALSSRAFQDHIRKVVVANDKYVPVPGIDYPGKSYRPRTLPRGTPLFCQMSTEVDKPLSEAP